MDYSKIREQLAKLYFLSFKVLNIDTTLPLDLLPENANDKLKTMINSKSSFMVCRFGENELRTIVAYINEKNNIKRNIKGLLRRESFSLDDRRVFEWMHNVAGFFPNDRPSLEKFSKLMLSDMKFADIICSWLPREIRVKNYLSKSCNITSLNILSPWEFKSPWTASLENKKILVVHPFAETIMLQYENREHLFKNKKVLPSFNLIALKAVQTAAGVRSNFASWFEALDFMCKKISNIDFDIAIIGAGAYGFPLAAHVKKIGKKTIHMAGATQLLFGIKGKRWDNTDFANKYYNKYWVRPNKNETPANINKVEGGSYW